MGFGATPRSSLLSPFKIGQQRREREGGQGGKQITADAMAGRSAGESAGRDRARKPNSMYCGCRTESGNFWIK